jgi:hypothetical protein
LQSNHPNFQLKQATEAGREPMSWANFEFRYNTQKRMPKMVYHQLKNVAKKTILRVLEKQPDLEGGDPVKNLKNPKDYFRESC